MDDFNDLVRDIIDRQLALMGLPPLKASTELRANSASNSGAHSCATDNSELAPIDLRGTVLWNRLRVGGWEDERRRLDALPWGYERKDKDYGPDSRRAKRAEFDEREP